MGVRTAGEFPWRGGGDPRRLGGLGIVEGLSSCRQLQPLSPRQAVMLVRVVLLKAVLWAQETLCSVCVCVWVCGCVCAFMDLFRTLRHRQITCSRQKLLCIFGKHKHTLSTGHLWWLRYHDQHAASTHTHTLTRPHTHVSSDGWIRLVEMMTSLLILETGGARTWVGCHWLPPLYGGGPGTSWGTSHGAYGGGAEGWGLHSGRGC